MNVIQRWVLKRRLLLNFYLLGKVIEDQEKLFKEFSDIEYGGDVWEMQHQPATVRKYKEVISWRNKLIHRMWDTQ